MYYEKRIPLDAAQPVQKKFDLPGHLIVCPSCPEGIGMRMRTEDSPDFLDVGTGFEYKRAGQPFKAVYLKWDAAAAGQELVLWIGDQNEISLAGGGKQPSFIADGDLTALGSKADAEDTDPGAIASLIALIKGLLRTSYGKGAPYVANVACVLAATSYDGDVNGGLGRNAHHGFLRSKTTNTGVMSVAVSADGALFSAFMTNLLPGEILSLDGMDVDTLRIQSTIAGDVGIIMAY